MIGESALYFQECGRRRAHAQSVGVWGGMEGGSRRTRPYVSPKCSVGGTDSDSDCDQTVCFMDINRHTKVTLVDKISAGGKDS